MSDAVSPHPMIGLRSLLLLPLLAGGLSAATVSSPESTTPRAALGPSVAGEAFFGEATVPGGLGFGRQEAADTAATQPMQDVNTLTLGEGFLKGNPLVPFVLFGEGLLLVVLIGLAGRRTKHGPDPSCPGFATEYGTPRACSGREDAGLSDWSGEEPPRTVVTLVHVRPSRALDAGREPHVRGAHRPTRDRLEPILLERRQYPHRATRRRRATRRTSPSAAGLGR